MIYRRLSVVRCPLSVAVVRLVRCPLSAVGGRPAREPRTRRSGFTLVELLVVIFIILLLSAVALPVVIPAFNHREVSAAGRTLQGALVGAQNRAANIDQPAGIRLLPDPTFPITWTAAGTIAPNTILAYNRIIPIESAPEYSEGSCTPLIPGPSGSTAYFGSLGTPLTIPSTGPIAAQPALVLIENLINTRSPYGPNSPTSWYWNIRVGDRIQLNGAGAWYTVVGPMMVGPNSGTNSELFVNVGPPAPKSTYAGILPSIAGAPVEFLMLSNGVDDNKNGWVDEGWDGVDNNGNGLVDESTEWEAEAWLGSVLTSTQVDVPYTIRRRPAPSQNAREVALPSSMVIDATTWSLGTQAERSRLPVNPFTGYVDIVINPDGTIRPTTTYSSSASFGMNNAFFHFWLAERQDLSDVPLNSNGTFLSWANGTAPYFLPIASPGSANNSVLLPGPYLKGEYSVLSLSTRSGNIVVNPSPPFLYNSSIGYNSQVGTYNPSNPFIQAEQGVNGGH